VRIVRETGKPIAQVARDLGINDGTLANWVAQDTSRFGHGRRVVESGAGRDGMPFVAVDRSSQQIDRSSRGAWP
jgi:transposase-like protein